MFQPPSFFQSHAMTGQNAIKNEISFSISYYYNEEPGFLPAHRLNERLLGAVPVSRLGVCLGEFLDHPVAIVRIIERNCGFRPMLTVISADTD
jgi:hypothetical protein